MPKEDYLLKYLEKLGRVVAAMFGFREKGFPEDSLRLADETFKELLKLNIDELAIMPVDRFIEIVRAERYNSSYLESLAKIAYETAKSYLVQENQEKANLFFSKSLHLYYLLNEKDKTFSFEREMMIDELKIKFENEII